MSAERITCERIMGSERLHGLFISEFTDHLGRSLDIDKHDGTKRGIYRHFTFRRSRILYSTQKGFDDGLIYLHDLIMEEPMRLIMHLMHSTHVRCID